MTHFFFMQLFVFLGITMLLYICTYHIFIRMFAYGRCKIAICPKFSTPQLILYFWNSQKYLPRRYTLQLCHNLSWAIRRNRLDKKMDMISFCTYFQKSYLKSLRNFLTDFSQLLINFITNYKSSIFRYTYKMIHQYRDIMALANKFSHELIRTTTNSTPQAAGY